jgi:hypothetical protein
MNGQQQRNHTTKTQNLESMLTLVAQASSEQFAVQEKEVVRLDERLNFHGESLSNLTRRVTDLALGINAKHDHLLSQHFSLYRDVHAFVGMGFWARLKWVVRGAK